MPILTNRFRYHWKNARIGALALIWILLCVNVAEAEPQAAPVYGVLMIPGLIIAVLSLTIIAILALSVVRIRNARNALEKSEEKYQSLFDGITDGLILADQESGSFVEVNAAICKMTGFSKAEMIHFSIKDALRESQEQYRRFVETANEGIWAMDANCRTTFVNRRMTEMLGYPMEEMLGKPVESFMFDEDLFDHQAKMENRKQGRGSTYERRFRCKDGREVWTQVSATAITDSAGTFAGSHALFTDITERKHMLDVLRENEARFRGYFDLGLIGMAITSPEKGWVECNDCLISPNANWPKKEKSGWKPSSDRPRKWKPSGRLPAASPTI